MRYIDEDVIMRAIKTKAAANMNRAAKSSDACDAASARFWLLTAEGYNLAIIREMNRGTKREAIVSAAVNSVASFLLTAASALFDPRDRDRAATLLLELLEKHITETLDNERVNPGSAITAIPLPPSGRA